MFKSEGLKSLVKPHFRRKTLTSQLGIENEDREFVEAFDGSAIRLRPWNSKRTQILERS